MNAATFAPFIRDRFHRLAPRERLFLAVGAVAVALFLLFMLRPEAEEPPVELGRVAPPASAPVAAPAATARVANQVPAPAPANLEAVVLKGVLGGGARGGTALILYPDGRQRLIRIGRDVVQGLKLKEVGVAHAVLTGAAGDVRLEIGRAGATSVEAAPAEVASVGAPASSADYKRATMQYRLGLEPQKSNGRIGGFAVRPGATLPALQQAGLQPGDILVAVNGQAFESEEKVLELSQEIAGSYAAEFEFVRNGKRMKATLPVNARQ